jgi:hypothetical protein
VKHLPLSLFGTQFAKDIRLTADYARAVLNVPFDLVKKQVVSFTFRLCASFPLFSFGADADTR